MALYSAIKAVRLAVLDLHQAMGDDAPKQLLMAQANQAFYNTSSMTLGKLGERERAKQHLQAQQDTEE